MSYPGNAGTSLVKLLAGLGCALALGCGGTSMQLGDDPGNSKSATPGSGSGDGGTGGGGGGGGSLGSDAGALPPPTEICGNGIDDDGNGLIDDDCDCTLGDSRPCYPAASGQGVGVCHAGVQSCEPNGELTKWGSCVGAVVPSAEVCNGVDDDCDGQVDEALVQACSTACGTGTETCSAGAWGLCTARQPTPEVCNGLDDNCDGQVDEGLVQACSSACGAGSMVCSAGAWGACNAPQPGVEVCNGLDDDCDGLVDEGCPVLCIKSPGLTTWQIHQGQGPMCFGTTFSQHGATGEYAYASIPPENDSGWAAHAAPNISFDDPSTLCGTWCTCLNGGDFTYFQTELDVPAGYAVNSLVVSIANVDDGVQITIFNSAHPGGVVSAGSYAYLGGGSTSDLASYIVSGMNRIVLTHVDDCCSVRRIANATISMNGTNVNPCP